MQWWILAEEVDSRSILFVVSSIVVLRVHCLLCFVVLLVMLHLFLVWLWEGAQHPLVLSVIFDPSLQPNLSGEVISALCSCALFHCFCVGPKCICNSVPPPHIVLPSFSPNCPNCGLAMSAQRVSTDAFSSQRWLLQPQVSSRALRQFCQVFSKSQRCHPRSLTAHVIHIPYPDHQGVKANWMLIV